MANEANKERLQASIATLENELKRYDDKSFNVYFFTLDSKGNPSATIRYTYQIAYALQEKGYKVTMLHQEQQFVGVAGWLGEKYAAIPHKNVEKENVEINHADFLFIPEIYANVMSQTKNLPCKRIVLLTNMNYLTEVIPVGVTWFDMGIDEAVTTTKYNENLIKNYFPGVKTHIVPPCIPSMFRKSDKPQDLIINFVAKDPTSINKVIKPFFWKYPIYKWISFRDLRGLPQENFADALREAAFTIVIDDDTNFGTSILEAANSGSLVLAKVPTIITDWMLEEDQKTLKKGVIWFDDLRVVPDVIASVVRSWLLDNIPAELGQEAEKLKDLYTKELQDIQIADVFEKTLFEGRQKEMKEALEQFKSQLNKEEEVKAE